MAMFSLLAAIFPSYFSGFLGVMGALFTFYSFLKKRRGFFLRFLLASVLYFLINLYFVTHISSWLLWQLLRLFLFALMTGFCCDLSPADCFYTSVWSYNLQETVFTIFCLFQPYLAAMFPSDGPGGNYYYFSLLLYAAAYPLFGYLALRKLTIEETFRTDWKQAMIAFLIVFPLSFFNHILFDSNSYNTANTMMVICSLAVFICCFSALLLQRLITVQAQMSRELTVIHQLWSQRQTQFEISKTSIDMINRKCHDLKHQVEALRQEESSSRRNDFLNEIENSIQIYDSTLKTGNEALDTLLTEKSLFCQKWNIATKYIVDGEKLSFIDIVDLYTIFGNALDNAIESVKDLPDPDCRIINVSVLQKDQFVSIVIENYTESVPVFENNLPVTTKADKENHGFGTKSIAYTVKKYGGSFSIQAKDHLFTLSILFPIPD